MVNVNVNVNLTIIVKNAKQRADFSRNPDTHFETEMFWAEGGQRLGSSDVAWKSSSCDRKRPTTNGTASRVKLDQWRVTGMAVGDSPTFGENKRTGSGGAEPCRHRYIRHPFRLLEIHTLGPRNQCTPRMHYVLMYVELQKQLIGLCTAFKTDCWRRSKYAGKLNRAALLWSRDTYDQRLQRSRRQWWTTTADLAKHRKAARYGPHDFFPTTWANLKTYVRNCVSICNESYTKFS